MDKLGETVPCLMERRIDGEWEGRTVFDAPEIDGRVVVSGNIPKPGLYSVQLTDAMGIDFRGALADPLHQISVVTKPVAREVR